MDQPSYPIHDADNHYYEALDAFTRHLDPAMVARCVQWCEIDGRQYHVVGGRVSRAVKNPTFDPIAKPGVLAKYFRGNPDNENPLEMLRDHEPIRPAYRDRDARLAAMDEQGIERVWMFPTLGMIYESLLRDDPVATATTFRAFNRWVEEDWGFAYQDRLFAAPYITLADPQWAVEEVEWAVEHDARTLVMLPAAPMTAVGRRSPFDPMFDPFWGRVNEAGITVVLHAGDSGLSSDGFADDGFAANFDGGFKPSIKFFAIEQAVHLWMLAMMLDNLPARFPNLRIASVENGAEFLPDLFRKMRSMAKKIPGYFGADDPVDVFRRHVWINPFWEDDIHQVVDLMGADRVLFGSDWPHIEGMPSPLDYLVEVKELAPEVQQRILHDNAAELTERRPA